LNNGLGAHPLKTQKWGELKTTTDSYPTLVENTRVNTEKHCSKKKQAYNFGIKNGTEKMSVM
jgi:hypothetical protein